MEIMLNKKKVCHTVALPFTLNSILKAKEELWKLEYFHHAINIIFKKNPLKKPKSFKIL